MGSLRWRRENGVTCDGKVLKYDTDIFWYSVVIDVVKVNDQASRTTQEDVFTELGPKGLKKRAQEVAEQCSVRG